MNGRRNRSPGSGGEVVCIACGTELPRSGAREYDKWGDRWDREDKRFEYLCKPCYRDCSHQPRDGLEAALIEAGAGAEDDGTFVDRYYEIVGGDRPSRKGKRD
jgi:hypothetical protein